MGCAEALDRIEAAVLGPGNLRALEYDQSVEGTALRQHISTCAECARELDAWRFAELALRAATPESLSPSPDSRSRLLAAVRRTPGALPADDVPSAHPVSDVSLRMRPSVPDVARIAFAAALAALIFVAGATLGGAIGIARPVDPASGRPAGAAFVSAAVDRVLAQAAHRIVGLSDTQGSRAGTLLFDEGTRQLVVVSRSLGPAPTDAEYGCYVVRDGEWTRIGRMVEYEGTSWWVGQLTQPTDAGRLGDLFMVALEAGAPTLTGAF